MPASNKKITAGGVEYDSLNAVANAFRVAPNSLATRIKNGMSADAALADLIEKRLVKSGKNSELREKIRSDKLNRLLKLKWGEMA